MMTRIRTALQNRTTEGGASAVEYVLLVAAIALLIVFAAFALGKLLNSKLVDASSCISTSGNSSCS